MRPSLWTWAAEAYGRPEVAKACLTLQDRYGQNVCLLLWGAWSGGGARQSRIEAVTLARRWDGEVAAPLRAARRGLKSSATLVDDNGRETLRQAVKVAELGAERLLLEALERMTDGKDKAVPTLGALVDVAAAWGPPPPREALAALAAALDAERS